MKFNILFLIICTVVAPLACAQGDNIVEESDYVASPGILRCGECHTSYKTLQF